MAIIRGGKSPDSDVTIITALDAAAGRTGWAGRKVARRGSFGAKVAFTRGAALYNGEWQPR